MTDRPARWQERGPVSGSIIAAVFLAVGVALAVSGGSAPGFAAAAAGVAYGFVAFRLRPRRGCVTVLLAFGVPLGFFAFLFLPDHDGAVPYIWLFCTIAGASLGVTRWRRGEASLSRRSDPR